MSPAPPHPREPVTLRGDAETTARVLFRLVGFSVAFAAASHLVLVHDGAFLALCARQEGAPAQPLRIEATLRSLPAGEAQVVGVGSSVLTSDVDPDRLASGFGLDFLPVALFGGSDVEVSMMTPLLLQARPRMVVVLATIWSLFDRVNWHDVRIYDPRTAWSLLSAREVLADRQEHTSLLLGSLHFAIRHRAALREMVAGTLQSGERPRTAPPPPLLARNSATAADFKCPSVNSRALETMARRLREAGVLVVLVSTPGNTAWDRDETLARRDDACLAAIAGATGATLVPRQAVGPFAPEAFTDLEHMGRAGRARFTETLGRALQAAIGVQPADHALQ